MTKENQNLSENPINSTFDENFQIVCTFWKILEHYTTFKMEVIRQKMEQESVVLLEFLVSLAVKNVSYYMYYVFQYILEELVKRTLV